jgi:acyl-CoA thioesterase-1
MSRTLWSIVPALALAACGGSTKSDEEVAPAAVAESGQTEAPVPAVTGPERRILAFGDSLFAGYRLAENEGYPEKLQAALRARGIDARVTDAAVSGDTTAAGKQRIDFVLDALLEKPDLALVELGGNDLLRGLSPDEAKANLGFILGRLQARKIPVLLMGMRAPPNAGPEYQARFDAIYADLAKQFGARLVPFFLEPVYDRPELLQADHIHPTAEGVDALIAATADDVAAALPND